MRSRFAGAVAVVSMLAASAVHAAQPGFYVVGSGGRAQQDVEPGPGLALILGPPLGTPTFPSPVPPIGGVIVVAIGRDSVTVDDEDVSWSGAVGYRINPYVAAEVAYMDFGTADVTERYTLNFPLPGQFTRSYSVNVRGPALSVLGSLPVGQFDVFLRAGVLFADEKIELGQSIPRSMTFGQEAWLAGVGVDWSFATRWAVRAEYQRTDKIDRNISVGENELDQFALSVLFRL